MKILITGGAGFIGSHLCHSLSGKGNDLICVDNFITGCKDNIRELLDKPGFRLIEHDISCPLDIDEDLDWVMHFASPASPKDYTQHPIKTLKVGTLGTHNCLGIAKKTQAKFFLASTSEIYGDPLIHPQAEEYLGNVNPIGLRSCYDESKRAAETLAFAYHRQHNIDIRIARIFNTYGPLMRIEDGRVVSNFIYQALTSKDITVYGKGNQTRSFCYIDDLVNGITKFMQVDYLGPLNLGNPDEFTIISLAKKILELTRSKSRIKFLDLPADDPKKRQPDIAKAKRLLGWQPRVTLDEGLKKTIPWFKQQIALRG